MTPRKNPFTLKGFMSILQGNGSNTSQKQEPKKPEEIKKDQNKNK